MTPRRAALAGLGLVLLGAFAEWASLQRAPLQEAVGGHDLRLAAADLSGNPGSSDLGSFAVVRDTTPPALSAAKAGGRVYWRAKDGESACCRVQLALSRSGERRYVSLTGARGAASVPAGYWDVTVVARDAAGNRAERPLGLVIGQAR